MLKGVVIAPELNGSRMELSQKNMKESTAEIEGEVYGETAAMNGSSC